MTIRFQTKGLKRLTYAWICLTLVALNGTVAYAASPAPRALGVAAIVVNQVGYLPGWPKRALIVGSPQEGVSRVNLINAQTRSLAASFTTVTARLDPYSGLNIATLDFSEFEQTGEFVFSWNGITSAPFRIDSAVYDGALTTLARSYYLQRCGVAIADTRGAVTHPICHADDGIFARSDTLTTAGTHLHSKGGWHDAGDYGKYVATTTVTLGRLLNTYEHHAGLFHDGQFDIPESGNGIPDMLDEAKVALEWLLTMQRQDGAVYRKLSGATWPPVTTPEKDTAPRFVYGISTPETAKFASVMAQAARIFKTHEIESAKLYEAAAERAWRFLETQPTQYIDWKKQDDAGSGPYVANEIDAEPALTHDRDDRLWAAAELYVTTGKNKYKSALAALAPDQAYTMFEWKDPSSLGLFNFMLASDVADLQGGMRAEITLRLLARADKLLARVADSPYRLAVNRFVWGSNKEVAEEAITLAYAHWLTGNRDYLAAALDQLDYLLGRNYFDMSFVTGIGTRFVENVSHHYTRATGAEIPGLLVGGPNELAQANIAPKSAGPLSYVDDARSYATNEYAIDYNASLIGLIGVLNASFRNHPDRLLTDAKLNP